MPKQFKPFGTQVLVLLFSEISHRVSADVLEVIRIAAAFYYVAVESMDRFLGEKVLSDVKNISTLVAVFRELERFVLEFVAACLNADGKVMNLVAGIVVVKLTRDRPALTLEHTREDIA